MANLTVVVEDGVLLRARKRALDQGTSVNALLRTYLENYVGRQNRSAAMGRLIKRAAATKARSSAAWRRDTLHDRS
jgi:hypothetical protein